MVYSRCGLHMTQVMKCNLVSLLKSLSKHIISTTRPTKPCSQGMVRQLLVVNVHGPAWGRGQRRPWPVSWHWPTMVQLIVFSQL